ncbi:unnamed protein product, partial [marine sediment metagenome]
IGALIASYIWVYKLGRSKAEREARKEALLNRYKLIYVPLTTLLLDSHITIVSAVLHPRISQRVKRAWPYIKKLNLTIGLQKLLDKHGIKTGAEVEFGAPFPLPEVQKIVKEHGQWADNKLTILLQQAGRSQYESSESDEFSLTDEELALLDHIRKKYHQLNRKLMLK